MLQFIRCTLIALIALSSGAFADNLEPAQVVEKFNAAVTARDMDTAMETLAEGSVQFQLRAVHPGMSDNPPLTADLRATWQTVGAILFPISDSYERKSEILNSVVDGDVATIWAKTTTHTERQGKEPMDLAFTEVYLLVKKPDGWKIAGIADNRAPDNVPVTGAS